MANNHLTPNQEKFCQVFLETGNQSEAYRQAYPKSKKWKPEAVNVQASTLMSNSKVSLRVKELQEELNKKHDITKDKLLKQLCDIAFLDIGLLADADGKIKDIKDLEEGTRRLLQGAELKALGSGDSAKFTMSYKLGDKLKAIEMINKMLGYNEPDKVEHSGKVDSNIKIEDMSEKEISNAYLDLIKK